MKPIFTGQHPRRRVFAIIGVVLLAAVALGFSAIVLTQDRWQRPQDATINADLDSEAPVETITPETEPLPDAVQEAESEPPAAPPQRLIAITEDGTVVRASVGACPEPAGIVEASFDGGAEWQPSGVEQFGTIRVLGLSASTASTVRLLATNVECQPQALRSFVGGTSWQPADDELATSWYLDLANPTLAHTPIGESELSCSAVSLVGAGERGVALCEDHSLLLSEDQGANWSSPVAVPGSAAVGASEAGFIVASVAEPDCAGVRTRTLREGIVGDPGACVEAVGSDGAISVALRGETAYLWAGDTWLRSEDAGANWQ